MSGIVFLGGLLILFLVAWILSTFDVLGGLIVFLFFIVLYDISNGNTELVDFQRSAFSVVLDLMLSEPAPFQLFDET